MTDPGPIIGEPFPVANAEVEWIDPEPAEYSTFITWQGHFGPQRVTGYILPMVRPKVADLVVLDFYVLVVEPDVRPGDPVHEVTCTVTRPDGLVGGGTAVLGETRVFRTLADLPGEYRLTFSVVDSTGQTRSASIAAVAS